MSMLALPPAGRERPRNLMNLAVLLLISGGLMLFGGLIAAYAHVAQLNRPWPPPGVKIDNYYGSMLSITAIMSAITMEWAVWSIKRDERRQAFGALGLSVGLALAFLNLLWFLGRKAGFSPGHSAFSVLFFALISAAGAVAIVGLVGMMMVLGRTIARQAGPGRTEVARVVGWYWEFVVVAWIAVYATVWVFTNH
jgi:heme/copper-type cytochrome/quinol oxidase subunit 3